MKKYGLIGYPLTHSFSKRFFSEKFEREGTEASYENFEIENISLFPEIIKNNPGLNGLNVTIPYKEQVIPLLDELDHSARNVGAVNTVKISRRQEKTSLKGYNTDTWGFETSLKPLLKPWHTKALILGTGGASKAIKYVLKKRNIEFISASIEELKENEIRYDQIDEKMMAERLLIIHATPLGTYPKENTFPPIPYECISSKHVLFDLVYNPEMTLFMKKGKQQGATVKNGYEMLMQQALKSYKIWNEEETGLLSHKGTSKVRILFVCLGNICRSPSAEAVFKRLAEKEGLRDKFEIDSAGTGAWHVGEPADVRMQRHAIKRDYHLDSISRQFDPETDFDRFDLIVGMDRENTLNLKDLARNEKDLKKIRKMTDFSREWDYEDVPDPYYGGDDGFELVLDLLEDASKGLLENIKSRISA